MSRQLSELVRHRWALLGVAAFAALALALTSMVAGTLSRSQAGDTIRLTAVFRDATGLRAGDDVRMAGVRIGRVADTRIGTGEDIGSALVTLEIDAGQRLDRDLTASVDYLNLMGQRYVALDRPGAPAGERRLLADGDTIPIGQTRPALDLTALFNAFQPVFDLLEPGDINRLAGNIVQVLQGQGPTLQHLLDQTTQLTSGVVDRDEALAEVVDNVSLVLETTQDHRAEIGDMMRGLGRLTTGLSQDRDRLATSLDSLARLSGTTADLVDDAGPGLLDDLEVGRDVVGHLAQRRERLGRSADAVSTQLATYLRTLSYGSFLNVYVCTFSIEVKGLPLTIPVPPGGSHSERC